MFTEKGRKEYGFTSLSTASRSYRDEIETWNREEFLYPSRIVQRVLSVTEGKETVLYNAAI